MNDTVPTSRRLLFGLQAKITLAAALVCVALATGLTSVGFLVVQEQRLSNVSEELQIRMKLLKQLTGGPAAKWAITDGKLTANGVVMNDNLAVVDGVSAVAGGVATLFQGDVRVATNVTRPDGTRGVGTKLAPGSAFDAVITQGRPYQGRNDILGRPHYTIYEPIKDQSGKQIGVFFVGLPTAVSEGEVSYLMRELVVAGIGMTMVASLILWFVAYRQSRPILRLTPVLEALAKGQDPGQADGGARRDEIGDMARAIETLRISLQQMRSIEAQRVVELQQASVERREARIVMADGFDAAVGQVVSGVAASAESLLQTAEQMEAGLASALTEISAASRASEQASTSVQSVAAS